MGDIVAGPLSGVRVIELGSLGPGPFAAMMLAEAGADVLCLVGPHPAAPSILNRSRKSVGFNLKHPDAVSLFIELISDVDILIEGYRPGVCERLGIGPDVCLEKNPALVYGRMTGFGQEGPLSKRAGHDINYIAISGALWPIGREGGRPVFPLNFLGDFGGGAMMLNFGILAALLEARGSGKGQVVDAAMVDGAAAISTFLYGMVAERSWEAERGVNLLDSGAHFYEVYETKDAGYMAVGALEPQFYELLLEGLGLIGESLPAQMDRSQWRPMKERFAEIFASRTRDHWTEIFAGVDACVTPVLSPSEAANHPWNAERAVFARVDGITQPNPAPRYSRTPASIRSAPFSLADGTDERLSAWGVEAGRLATLRESGAIF